MLHNNQDIFTVLNAPTYYPLQTKMGYCGPCQIKTIVERKTKGDKLEVFYTNTLREKVVGGMSPLSVYKGLKKYGFHPKMGIFKGSTPEKIEKIKMKLKFGPVILMIFNSPQPKTKFGVFKALFSHHYVSVRGYDEKRQIFYVYNSNPKKPIDKTIPIGNQIYTYEELIILGRYMVMGLIRNFYISLG